MATRPGRVPTTCHQPTCTFEHGVPCEGRSVSTIGYLTPTDAPGYLACAVAGGSEGMGHPNVRTLHYLRLPNGRAQLNAKIEVDTEGTSALFGRVTGGRLCATSDPILRDFMQGAKARLESLRTRPLAVYNFVVEGPDRPQLVLEFSQTALCVPATILRADASVYSKRTSTKIGHASVRIASPWFTMHGELAVCPDDGDRLVAAIESLRSATCFREADVWSAERSVLLRAG